MTAGNFSRALEFTLRYEGGKSNDPRDPGGRTNQGVTQSTYDAYRKGGGLSPKDVYAMSLKERDEIYKHGYWDKVTGDSLPSGVDLCVFDYSVNSGPGRALRTYALVGHGKKTSDAIHDICSSRLSFLHALRTWTFFGSGWAKRVSACEATAIELAGASFGTASNRADGDGRKRSVSFTMLITSLVVITGKMIHNLSWWQLCIMAVLITISLVSFLHSSKVTKIRVDILNDAGNRAEVLGLAMDKMQAAKRVITQR